MGKWLDEALRMQPYIRKGIQSLDDADALEIATAYPDWAGLMGETVEAGFKFRHGEALYKTRQTGYTFVETYVPGSAGTESLFEVINEEHSGGIDDPIPYSGNMALEQGKYYTQDGKTYLCIRDTGLPVYHRLSELVGIYVEEV